MLEEVTSPGSATVESGPNAPWTCVPMASPMMCEHPETTLNPGESATLKLGFEPGAAWQWRGIRNCAEYDYTASGKEPFGDLGSTIGVKTVAGAGYGDQIENCSEVLPVPGETNLANNRSCAKARITLRDPGKPAMRITKTCDGAEQCSEGFVLNADGLCVCPRGTDLRDGACRKREIVCPKGTVLQNGTCVPIDSGPRCRKGQVVRNGKCVNVTIEQRCPKGTVGTPPNCRTLERQKPILEINPNLVNPDVLRQLLPQREKQDNGGSTNRLLKIQ